jgi:nucleotide-binding universal stress UspA family protein
MTIHILVATDGSEESREAVRFGASLTRALSGRLTLVHIVPPHPSEEPPRDPHDVDALLNSAQAEAAKYGVEVTTRVEVGDPAEAIVGVRREIAADMLVVGTHGRKGIARVVLGSVAESLYKRALCPVAVVRKFDRSSGSFGPLVAPTDFSDGGNHAVQAAALLARTLDVQLKVLHVLPEALPPKGEEDPEAMRRAAETLRRNAEARLRSLAEKLRLKPEQVELALVTGVDAAEIVHIGKEIDAGCIVMGTRGLSGLPRVLLGSVTDQVLREAPCPVLVVPFGSVPSGWWWGEGT